MPKGYSTIPFPPTVSLLFLSRSHLNCIAAASASIFERNESLHLGYCSACAYHHDARQPVDGTPRSIAAAARIGGAPRSGSRAGARFVPFEQLHARGLSVRHLDALLLTHSSDHAGRAARWCGKIRGSRFTYRNGALHMADLRSCWPARCGSGPTSCSGSLARCFPCRRKIFASSMGAKRSRSARANWKSSIRRAMLRITSATSITARELHSWATLPVCASRAMRT